MFFHHGIGQCNLGVARGAALTEKRGNRNTVCAEIGELLRLGLVGRKGRSKGLLCGITRRRGYERVRHFAARRLIAECRANLRHRRVQIGNFGLLRLGRNGLGLRRRRLGDGDRRGIVRLVFLLVRSAAKERGKQRLVLRRRFGSAGDLDLRAAAAALIVGHRLLVARQWLAIGRNMDGVAVGEEPDELVAAHVGYPRDLALIAKIPDVDIVVGGHSHSLLSNTDPKAEGPYPTMVDNPGGYKVPVVQAASYSKYLGDLVVNFDDSGVVKDAKGDPILIDSAFTPDPAVIARIAELAKPIEELRKKVIGSSESPIEGDRKVCRVKECSMGNLVADAMTASPQPICLSSVPVPGASCLS